MTATREKKLQFIHSFGPMALEKAVTDMLRRKESEWLTDDQIDDLTEKMVSDARWTQHNNMRNRSFIKATRDFRGEVPALTTRPRPDMSRPAGKMERV